MRALIYYFTSKEKTEIATRICNYFEGNYKLTTSLIPILESSQFYISFANNEESDHHKQQFEFPRGYINFPYYIDISWDEDVSDEDGIQLLTELLEWLWKNGIPAVCESDYDFELPNEGGFIEGEQPWPKV